MKGWREIVAEAKKQVTLLSVDEVREKIQQGDPVVLIDVREAEEYGRGRIPEGVHIPRGRLEMEMEDRFSDLDQEIILHCAGGGRSAVAALALKQMGYTRVASMEGGFGGWVRAGFPVA